MKRLNSLLSGGICLFLVFLLPYSCSEEKIHITSDDSDNIQNETSSDAYFAESQDLTAVTVSADNATNGGRIIVVNDPRLSCATITIEPADNSTLLVPKGTLTIDFGSGCVDNRGTTRKGKIIITYNGRRFLPGSSVVTTLQDYQINGVQIEGTRTVTNATGSTASQPVFTTTMENGKISWDDGTSITRDEQSTATLKPGATADDNQWSVTGSATGTNRRNKAYSVSITKPLVYKRSCAVNDKIFIAVSGTKELVVENKKVTVDYGAGACDKLVEVTILGKSKQLELK